MSEIVVSHEAVGESVYLSIPRGGPIFVPDMNLKDELDGDSIDSWADEVSVDELKIITEEELVNKAFKEMESTVNLMETSVRRSSSRTDNSISSELKESCAEGSGNGPDGIASESLRSLQLTVYDDKSRKKRKGNRKSDCLDERYMAKVKELARIKQQQDEDMKAARLHSFNGGLNDQGRGSISIDKSLKMTSLRGTNSTRLRYQILVNM